MVPVNKLRIDSILLYEDSFVKVTSITKKSIAVSVPQETAMERLVGVGSVDIKPVRLNKDLITDKLHFVQHKGPDYREDALSEFTDGRIIVRLNEDHVTVFKPNEFPWAEALNIHMDYVCTIHHLHELQNIYLDLFDIEMEVPFMG